jgi:HPt (histidine-containing phosphotransfer) domain-containing protein
MPHEASGGASASVAVLDTAEATSRVLGNGALYLRMLRRFEQDHPPGISPIRAALDSADLALAHRLAHTLKGTAGMIGAHRLHQCASMLEQSLRIHGAHAAHDELQALEDALHEVLVVVERLLAGEPAGGRPAPLASSSPKHASAAAAPLLRQLAQLLDMGDGAAIDLLAQAGATLKPAMGAIAFSEVMLAVNAFDFEAALAALQRALPAELLGV